MQNVQAGTGFVLMLLASRTAGRRKAKSPFPWHLMFGNRKNHNGAEALSASVSEVNEKVKELLVLAQEQGYLTYEDVQESLTPEQSSTQLIAFQHSGIRSLEFT